VPCQIQSSATQTTDESEKVIITSNDDEIEIAIVTSNDSNDVSIYKLFRFSFYRFKVKLYSHFLIRLITLYRTMHLHECLRCKIM